MLIYNQFLGSPEMWVIEFKLKFALINPKNKYVTHISGLPKFDWFKTTTLCKITQNDELV